MFNSELMGKTKRRNTMDNYLISYFDPNAKNRVVEYAYAKELLLMYFSSNKMNYYSISEDGGSFQLYYRLGKTLFSLQQCIYVKGFKYLCRTTVAEIKPKSQGAIARLQEVVEQMNNSIDIGKFVFDTIAFELQFYDEIRINPEEGVTSLNALYDYFDRLIFWPRFLLDVEYGDVLLDI